jgi:cytochrome d ubiquinol oxidase subunit I
MASALLLGAFFVAGVSAWLILRNKSVEDAKRSLALSVKMGFASVLIIAGLGHWHAVQVAHTQPAKLATFEGLFETRTNAPMLMFGIPKGDTILYPVELPIPGALSLLIAGTTSYEVQGRNAFPKEDRPPLAATFISFHTMIGLWSLFLVISGWSMLRLRNGKIFGDRKLLKVLLWSIPLPLLAIQLGWATAEVGRQPWIVYNLMRTSDAYSLSISGGEVLFSIIMFVAIYLLLSSLYLYLMFKEAAHGPQPLTANGKE